MKTLYHSERDDWTHEGPKINSADRLTMIRKVLEDVGPIIVEHGFYHGGRGREHLIFLDYDEFVTWLDGTTAGDTIWVWNYEELCRDDNPLTHGKCPDENGKVPLGGAY